MARPRKPTTDSDIRQALDLVGVYAVTGDARAIDPADLLQGHVTLHDGERLVCVPRLEGDMDPRVEAFRCVQACLDAYWRQRKGRFAITALPTAEELEVWRRHRRARWSLTRLAREGNGLLGPLAGKHGADRLDTRRTRAAQIVRKVDRFFRTPAGQPLRLVLSGARRAKLQREPDGVWRSR